jgi:hypothetical protein
MVIGFIKVGVRYLYLYDGDTSLELNTISVLDFFVFHSHQRQGHGKSLFDKMLRFLNTQPYKLALDSPNEKMIKFMSKNYSLSNVIKQNNNFLVYKEFFSVNF